MLLKEGKLFGTLYAYNPYGEDYTLFLPTDKAIDEFIQQNQDYENFEENDSSYDRVYPVPEKQKESLLSKMVIENTEDVVKSLDKETLMKLKSVIDSRLRLL